MSVLLAVISRMSSLRFKMKLVVKVHSKDGKTLVAVCDKDLLGSVFEEGDHILDLSGDFYDGDEMSEEEAGDLIRNADIVNLVGVNAVKVGVDDDIIDEDAVQTVEGVPYAIGIVIEDE